MKVYVTKYALTAGIQTYEATVCTDIDSRMIDCGGSQYFHKPYWHETRAEAVAHANELRNRKIKSVEAQLKRLHAQKFV